MVRTWLLRWALLAAAAALVPGLGSSQTKKDQPPLPIDEATCNAVIDEALRQLEEAYVFPEVAAKMAKAVRQRQADKAYAKVKTGEELAELLTQHLREVSRDKHLRVIWSAEKLPKRRAAQEPTPEMKERQRQLVRTFNAGYRKVERLGGNIGYLAVDGFANAEAAARPAAAAMNFLADTQALIIDLRRNSGGSPYGVALLCSYFFDEKPVHLNSMHWRKDDRTEEFWTHKELAGKRYLNKDVYLLTSERTFSGGEEFAYNLQTQKRATVVGETTGGGAHPAGPGKPICEHFLVIVPHGRPVNPITKTNWEGTGVKPDVAVPADEALEKAHELAIQKILANAQDEETRRLIQMDLDRSRQRSKDKPMKGPDTRLSQPPDAKQELRLVRIELASPTPGNNADEKEKPQAEVRSDPRAVNAAEAILNAFDKYRVVALGERHGLQEQHDFIQSLIRNPVFAAKVNDIVVECGNALYQDMLDRYIAGEDVPMAEVRHVWRDTTQAAVGLWNALVYEQLFTTVREVNMKLPAEKRLRVLAGDPPIDWKKVKKRGDADTLLGQRDSHFASVVEQQVLAKNRKALLIIGTVHLFKVRPRATVGTTVGPAPPAKKPGNVTQFLEERHPGSTIVIAPHSGFGLLRPELADLNTKLEARMAAWPKPSLVFIKDTWLGTLETTALFPPMIGPDGRPRDPFAGLTFGDLVDAYLYLGPRDSLTRSHAAPETLKDQAYLEELNRRSQIIFGKPFDRQQLFSSGKQFYDPNARPPMPPVKRAP
jgi:retinol-binding protein 3